MVNIAARVIQKCGGHKMVAKWLGLSLTRIYCFTYSKAKGGTGGLIPAEHQRTLLNKAKKHGVDLTPADFFEAEGKAA